MSLEYARIAARIYNAPLLLTPSAADIIGDYVSARVRGDDVAQGPQGPQALDSSLDRALQAGTEQGARRYSIDQGIALIGINGELVNRGAWIGASSGLTSYEGIAAQFKAAARDSAVQGVLLEINSPGGEAAGISAVTEAMQALRASGKPIWAIANAAAMSAAYWIASTADRVAAVPDANGVGSIGVVWMHVDRTEQLQKAGARITVVQAGAKKTQFSSLASLSDDARARAEEVIGALYDRFVSHVALARGIAESVVRDTEAAVLMPAEAKKIGLINDIATVSQFHASMVKAIRGNAAQPSKSKSAVSAINPLKEKIMDPESTITAADFDAAKQTALTDGMKAGASAERARISAILASDEGKARPKLAAHLALSSTMSADEAKGILANSAVETAPAASADLAAPKNLLADAMANAKNANANVEADVGGKQGDPNAPKTIADKVVDIKARAQATLGAPIAGIR